MIKWLIVFLGFVGAVFMINMYLPHTWVEGINLPLGKTSYHIPWAYGILGAVVIAGARLKGK